MTAETATVEGWIEYVQERFFVSDPSIDMIVECIIPEHRYELWDGFFAAFNERASVHGVVERALGEIVSLHVKWIKPLNRGV